MSNRLVIIPTYNEIENITQIISAVFELSLDFHFLIVDDGSPDVQQHKLNPYKANTQDSYS